jgi:hypothetical protein
MPLWEGTGDELAPFQPAIAACLKCMKTGVFDPKNTAHLKYVLRIPLQIPIHLDPILPPVAASTKATTCMYVYGTRSGRTLLSHARVHVKLNRRTSSDLGLRHFFHRWQILDVSVNSSSIVSHPHFLTVPRAICVDMTAAGACAACVAGPHDFVSITQGCSKESFAVDFNKCVVKALKKAVCLNKGNVCNPKVSWLGPNKRISSMEECVLPILVDDYKESFRNFL